MNPIQTPTAVKPMPRKHEMPNNESSAQFPCTIEQSRSRHFKHGANCARSIVEILRHTGIFFTQTRIGKFGQPFKMIKFRTMYQDKVEEDFDDDLNEVQDDDKRIMPFCKFLRQFHIDELPQMINVLRGEMSIIGPRPVREEVYYENKNRIPFWESRNWVRPGWCGWQQINVCEPSAEERLEYDLYYIKHRHILWEFTILIQYVAKVLSGRCK